MTLQIDEGQTLKFSVKDLIGQRIAVLGMSGSGKTNTTTVLLEELLPFLPLTVVDIEGEYHTLREQFSLLIVGRSEAADLPLLKENAAAIAELSLKRGISVILDLSDYDQEEMQDILFTYFSHLWKLEAKLKKAYTVVIEECHEIVPQGANSPLKTLLTQFALRGRKRGIGMILDSQRSAKVEKSLLTQAGILFLHLVMHPTDLNVYKDLIPEDGKVVEQGVRTLDTGEAFVVHGRQVDKVHVRLQHTSHAGATPGLSAQPHLKEIEATLLEELRAATTHALKDGGSDEVSKLKKSLRDAEVTIEELRAVITRQQEQIELLSRLSVHMNDIERQAPLPSTLTIEQATVHHMHTPSQVVQTALDRRVVESTTAKPAIKQPMQFNEAKFRALQARIQQLPALERAILRVLVEQGSTLSIQDLADWLQRPESVIRNHPPQGILRLGVATRARSTHGYLYRTTLIEYLHREFPKADALQLQTRLLPSQHP